MKYFWFTLGVATALVLAYHFDKQPYGSKKG